MDCVIKTTKVTPLNINDFAEWVLRVIYFCYSGGDEGSEEGSRSGGKSKLEALTEEAKLGNVTAVVGKVCFRDMNWPTFLF